MGDTSFPVVVLIGDIPIDVAIVEGHEFPSDVTKFPVEEGAKITDNIRIDNEKITLECLVSNAPLESITRLRRAYTKVIAATQTNYARAVYDALLAQRGARKPIDITTSLDFFPSMAVTNLSVPRSAGEANGLRFTVTAEHIAVVASARGTVRVSNPICGDKANLGPKNPIIQAVDHILWRIGAPPGGPKIILTEWVTFGHYTSPQEAGRATDAFGNPVFNRKSPGTKDFRSVVRSTGPWMYFHGDGSSSNPYTPLTARELRDFKLDMARDQTQDATGTNTWLGDPPQAPTKTPVMPPHVLAGARR